MVGGKRHGFSMASVLVASAVLGSLALVAAQVIGNLRSGVGASNRRAEVTHIKNELALTLSRPDLCASSFHTQSADGASSLLNYSPDPASYAIVQGPTIVLRGPTNGPSSPPSAVPTSQVYSDFTLHPNYSRRVNLDSVSLASAGTIVKVNQIASPGLKVSAVQLIPEAIAPSTVPNPINASLPPVEVSYATLRVAFDQLGGIQMGGTTQDIAIRLAIARNPTGEIVACSTNGSFDAGGGGRGPANVPSEITTDISIPIYAGGTEAGLYMFITNPNLYTPYLNRVSGSWADLHPAAPAPPRINTWRTINVTNVGLPANATRIQVRSYCTAAAIFAAGAGELLPPPDSDARRFVARQIDTALVVAANYYVQEDAMGSRWLTLNQSNGQKTFSIYQAPNTGNYHFFCNMVITAAQ
jgi:hypothetical protein